MMYKKIPSHHRRCVISEPLSTVVDDIPRTYNTSNISLIQYDNHYNEPARTLSPFSAPLSIVLGLINCVNLAVQLTLRLCITY
jgi:hypothetical protein